LFEFGFVFGVSDHLFLIAAFDFFDILLDFCLENIDFSIFGKFNILTLIFEQGDLLLVIFDVLQVEVEDADDAIDYCYKLKHLRIPYPIGLIIDNRLNFLSHLIFKIIL